MATLQLNEVRLCGRLTADVELKQTLNGTPVCSFSLAINRRVARDKPQEADFIDCVAWRGTAEFIAKYFKKGSSLYISGSLQKRYWSDNNGQKRYVTEVIVEKAEFVDNKADETPSFVPEAYTNFEDVKEDEDLPF